MDPVFCSNTLPLKYCHPGFGDGIHAPCKMHLQRELVYGQEWPQAMT
jgi:hypothetical protein